MKTNSTSVFVGHGDEATRRNIEAAVEQIGLSILGRGHSREILIEFCIKNSPDLIITGTEYPDGDGIEALIEIARHEPLPAIVISRSKAHPRLEEAMDDHVMAYLTDPVSPDDLKPTVHVVLRRFAQFRELRQEVADLREALETRKKLERAKGILMVRHDLSEEEAYLRLRDLATSRRTKLSEVATLVIESETKGAKKGFASDVDNA